MPGLFTYYEGKWADASSCSDWHDKDEKACLGVVVNESVGWIRSVSEAEVVIYSSSTADRTNLLANSDSCYVSQITSIPLECVRSVTRLVLPEGEGLLHSH